MSIGDTIKSIIAGIATKVGAIAAVVGAVILILQVGYCRAKEAEAAKSADLASTQLKVAQLLTELHAVQGRLVKSVGLTPTQSKVVAAIKKADPRATVASTSSVDVTINDTAPGTATETFVEDRYHRFRFDLPSGLLHRSQKFKFDVLTVRGADGSYQLQKTEFREYDPKTGEEISVNGVDVDGHFEFTDLAAPGPGRWHLRGVAGVSLPLGIGAGVELNPFGKYTVSLLGLYRSHVKDGVGVLAVGYRLFNSTVAIGPFVGISTKGGVVVGGLATIEVTR